MQIYSTADCHYYPMKEGDHEQLIPSFVDIAYIPFVVEGGVRREHQSEQTLNAIISTMSVPLTNPKTINTASTKLPV